jgi:hypothetical protein
VSKEYRISSIKDFLAIPEESIAACLADFKAWIGLAREGSEFSKDFNDLIGIPDATSFIQDSFIWLDDGLSGISRIQLTDHEGEEFVRIEFEGGAK